MDWFEEDVLMVADIEDVAVFAFASVAVTLTVYVPCALYVVVKVEPVPVDGLPPVAVQLKL